MPTLRGQRESSVKITAKCLKKWAPNKGWLPSLLPLPDFTYSTGQASEFGVIKIPIEEVRGLEPPAHLASL